MSTGADIVCFKGEVTPYRALNTQEVTFHRRIRDAFGEIILVRAAILGFEGSHPEILPVACTPNPECWAGGAGPRKVGVPPPDRSVDYVIGVSDKRIESSIQRIKGRVPAGI